MEHHIRHPGLPHHINWRNLSWGLKLIFGGEDTGMRNDPKKADVSCKY